MTQAGSSSARDRRGETARETLALARLAWPICLSNVALMAMGLVDAAVVGRVSKQALAGVSLGHALSFSALCVGMGLATAIEPLAAQALGAKQPGSAWRVFLRGIVVALVGAPLTALATYGALGLLGPLGIDPALAKHAHAYVLLRLAAIPFWLLYYSSKSLLGALSRPWPLLWAGLLANVINGISCPVCVYGDPWLQSHGLPTLGLLPMGAAGAGLTTAFSSGVLALVMGLAVWRYRPKPEPDAPATPAPGYGPLLKLGLPIGLHMLVEGGVFSLTSLLAARFGAAASSAHQIALGLASFTFMGALGLSTAVGVRVGYAAGAHKPLLARRIGRLGVALGLVYMAANAVVFLIFAEVLAKAFSPDPAVIAVTAGLLKVAAAFQLADGLQVVAAGALRGIGDTAFASVATLIAHWLIGLPLGLLLAFQLQWHALGLWWGLCVGLSLVSLALVVRFEHLLRPGGRLVARLGQMASSIYDMLG